MGIRDRLDRWRYERDVGRIVRGRPGPPVFTRASQRVRLFLGLALLVILAAAVVIEWVDVSSVPRALVTGVFVGGILAAAAYLGGKEGWAGRHMAVIRLLVVLAYLALVGAVGLKLLADGGP